MATDTTRASPETRKLRSSELDLKITVGEKENTVVHWYHYQIMANHSRYIDTMLASPMKESNTYEISFPDIEPEVWDSMMLFVSDPVAIRDMKAEDVMLVATAYDQYDFDTGIKCCDRVLLEYFQKVYETRDERPSDLNFAIDAFLCADKFHLEEAKKKGIEYFKYVLESDKDFGRCMFDEGSMKRLAPIIAEENLLSDAEGEWTKEEILSPIFPKLFVSIMSLNLARSQLDSSLPWVQLSGTNSEADGLYTFSEGSYTRDRTVAWGGVQTKITICLGWNEPICDDWVIGGVDDGDAEIILWERPFSENSWIPPEDHWEAVDELASGIPKLQYCTSRS
jgi:hypothetical protein